MDIHITYFFDANRSSTPEAVNTLDGWYISESWAGWGNTGNCRLVAELTHIVKGATIAEYRNACGT